MYRSIRIFLKNCISRRYISETLIVLLIEPQPEKYIDFKPESSTATPAGIDETGGAEDGPFLELHGIDHTIIQSSIISPNLQRKEKNTIGRYGKF